MTFAAPVGDLAVTGSAPSRCRPTSDPVPAPWFRRTDSWQRIRSAVGPCSTEVDPDQHADDIWSTCARFAERPWPRRKADG